jgi:hypothetical protein
MLSDEKDNGVQSGGLAEGLHRPATWLAALIDFIAEQLPLWRDRSDRPRVEGETLLTAQLCAHLNSAARKSAGWDVLQFRMEEPDAVKRSRRIDLAPAPAGETIWIEGRRYSDFDPLVPIECKRLPTPVGAGRDKREYLRVSKGSTGGIQRFKAGHHGAAHTQGAMIAYVQAEGLASWVKRIDVWIRALVRASVAGWTADDRLRLDRHYPGRRVAVLTSEHQREHGLAGIALRHLWIEITQETANANVPHCSRDSEGRSACGG